MAADGGGGSDGGAPVAKRARVEGAAEPDARAGEAADAEALPAGRGADAEAEADAEAAAFAGVRKNRVAGLAQLVRLAQRIERVWEVEGGVLRMALLRAFRDALLSLRGHKDKECAALADLGVKMKSLDMDLRHFLTMALPIERQHTRGLRDDEFLVTRPDDISAIAPCVAEAGCAGGASSSKADARREEPARMPLVLVLDNLRSAFNVGAIFRTAECLRVQRLYLCGYTATPEDSKGQTARAAMGADAYVPWEHRPRTLPVLEELREAGMHVVGLETVANAPVVQRYRFPATGVALLLGNERHGIEADLLAACSGIVRIPCRGVKNSLNVGIATAIAGYEIARQWGWGDDGEAPDGSAAGAAASSAE